uniref:Reverse transcriptase zinc-binding domain-containing protein n=1 Tax=Nicotiana tabacum TaxID=4097 RepID=A0A1S4ACN8_TOBAC|nr:PREDICTED: uncharacterized protein LOC107796204 [Nicotiana tabacum]
MLTTLRRIWEVQANQALWVIRKIIKAKETFGEAGYQEDDVLQLTTLSVKEIYCKLRGDYPRVEWWRLIWNNHSPPRWNFILFLGIHKRLFTKTRLAQWCHIDDLSCPLCNAADESIDHLFFQCQYSANVWSKLLKWQGVTKVPTLWQVAITWAARHMQGKSTGMMLFRMTLAACLYCVWNERNLRLFQQRSRPADMLVDK